MGGRERGKEREEEGSERKIGGIKGRERERDIAGTLNIIFFGAQRFPVVWLARGWTGEVARWEGGSRRGRIHTDPGSSPFRAGALW